MDNCLKIVGSSYRIENAIIIVYARPLHAATNINAYKQSLKLVDMNLNINAKLDAIALKVIPKQINGIIIWMILFRLFSDSFVQYMPNQIILRLTVRKGSIFKVQFVYFLYREKILLRILKSDITIQRADCNKPK